MIQYSLKDNNVDSYISITPKQVIFSPIPKEESTALTLKEWNVGSLPANQTTAVNTEDLAARKAETDAVIKQIPMNSNKTATDYIGIQRTEIPYMINSTFTDFKLLSLVENDIATIAGGNIEEFMVELFDDSDSERVVTLFNGLQLLKVPQGKLQNTEGDDLYGTYYIKVTPKYIDLEVTEIKPRNHRSLNDVLNSVDESLGLRRQTVVFNSSNLLNTPWDFESTISQTGRLWGSVVEIWNNSLSIKKQTKVVFDSVLDTNGLGEMSISPDIVGYDALSQIVSPGDILRVYPRETYFEPIFIEVSFTKTSTSLEKAIAYMVNDAARDLKTGIVEIYDETGITVDSANQSIDGNIIDSYQIGQVGDKEVRRKIKIE